MFLGSPSSSLVNITVGRREMSCEDEKLMQLVQDRVRP